ncbi:apolipophorins-like [Contarinia nasturtii]|uniref:apolipophorins-like n=1 Tax=Contarinia nasturtii TaxID=265458 RepID=UPI0012D4B219|nr:apolipophorins-like [Contarinia nasturtii]
MLAFLLILFTNYISQNIFWFLYKGNGCKQGCPSTSKGSKLKYQPGQVYSYNFESTVSISIGKDPQDIQLQVQGTAHVHSYSNCQYGLDLNDVTFIGPDKVKTKFNSKLQLSKIVQFTLSDDKLESEICANPDDSDVSLNIKRALISLLQLNDGPAEEVDIFGKCPTNYAVTKNDDGSYVVTKTRDLNACSYRENFVSGIITGVFNENSNIKSTPLLNGNYTNEVRVNRNGIVESAQVVEDYVLVPFSNSEVGVRARVITSFRLKDQKPNDGETLSVSVPRSLIYESVKKPQADNYKIAKKSLLAICKTYEQREVGAQDAGQFIEIIRSMRHMKTDDILLLYKDATQHSNPICRKVCLDAVFRVASADSINAIAMLLENNKINEIRLAYLSFNLATSVNKETINILTKLVDKNGSLVLKESYLSIGNLVKKYIQQYGNENDADLVKLLDKLADKLGNCKSIYHSQEDLIIAILKGLRGVKGVTGSYLDKVVTCSSEGNAGRVRTAAIQAFASASCDNKIQSAALNLLKNRKDDSEFRIEAYLALVDCSSPEIADEISKLLDDETVYQVGSFIVSHLKNLRASTDLYREKARKDFANVRVSQIFPNDILESSFNHGFSYEIGSFGLSGSIDSNVIYSQKSFTPRSFRTNFTAELFGSKFNIFELSGRQENFDLVLERYFGLQGYFNTLNKQENVGSSRDEIDFSVKMFGSELYFLSLSNNLPSSKDFTKEFGRLLQSVVKDTKEGGKKQYEAQSLFLDAEFSYPTSSGFPLKIQSQGAGAFRLEASLKADFKDIQANPKNTKFAVSISPSYNVELTGIISVDGYEVATGVKVTSNVHSATGAELSFELLGQGKGVDVKVDFPLKKQEILSFDLDIFFIQQNLGHPSITHNLKSAQNKYVTNDKDCFDQFQKYLGVTVCYEFYSKKGEKLHALAYIKIEKQYQFNATYDDSVAQKPRLELVFDTPESVDKRKVSIGFESASQQKPYLRAKIVSPYKSVEAEIAVNNNDKEWAIYGQAKIDALQYLLKLGLKKNGSSTRREYTPYIEYSNPDAIPYKASGKLIIDSSQSSNDIENIRCKFEKLTIGPAQSDGKFGPLVFDGLYEYKKLLNMRTEFVATDLDVKYKDSSANIKGNALIKNQELKLDLDFSLLSDIANGRVNFLHQTISNLDQKKSDQIFVFVYGRDFESTTKRIKLTTDYETEKKDDKYVSIAGKNTLIISSIPIKLLLNGGYRAGHFDYEFIGDYDKCEVSSKLNVDVNQTSKGDWDVKFKGAVNNHNIQLVSSRDIDDAAQQEIDLDAVIVVGQKPLKLDFKFVLNPKSAQSNGKLLNDNAEVISFNSVLNSVKAQIERSVPSTRTPSTTLPPPIPSISVVITSPEFQIGETMRLPCNAYDNIIHTPATVIWRKANGSLPDRSHQKNGVLTITNSQLADAGEYICRAESKGHYEKSITIMIRDNRSNQTENLEPWQVFHGAVLGENLRAIEELLANGTDVNIRDRNGRTPLFTAARNGRHIMVESLLRNGAHINLKDYYGAAPIHTATSEGHKRVVEILIKNGIDKHSRDENGNAPINIAAQKGYEEIADLLLKNSVNVNNQDRDGKTALFTASSFGRIELVKMLLSHGANVNLQDNREQTPLFSASLAGFDDIVKVLVEKKLDINKQDQNGWSPLHVATQNGFEKIVDILVRNGADVNLQNQNKDTAMNLATRKGKMEIIEILEKRRSEWACESYSDDNMNLRIYGGVETTSEEFPWMAALGYLDYSDDDYKVTFRCGGTIISDYFILTAAHCTSNPKPVVVRLGKNTLSISDDDGIKPENYRIEEIKKHPNYSRLTMKNDIALIRVTKRISFKYNISPACLQTDVNDIHVDVPLIVTGWGRTTDKNLNTSNILMKTQLKTMPLSECNKTLSKWNKIAKLSPYQDGISHGQYCAYDPQARNDSCQGDSGGPLQYYSDSTFVATVVGIVSFGESCGTAWPAIYTRIAYYIDWIEGIVWPPYP